MKDLKVTIEGKEYPLEQEVFDLIHDISLERDELKQYANQRVIEELKQLHIYPDINALKNGFKGNPYVKEIDITDRIKELERLKQ